MKAGQEEMKQMLELMQENMEARQRELKKEL